MQNQPGNDGMTALGFEGLFSVLTKKKIIQNKEAEEEAQYLLSLMILEGFSLQSLLKV